MPIDENDVSHTESKFGEEGDISFMTKESESY